MIKKHYWEDAYPKFFKFLNDEKAAPFKLGEGVYYLNAMEKAGSCIETEIIASYNVINLILKNEAIKKGYKIDRDYLRK